RGALGARAPGPRRGLQDRARDHRGRGRPRGRPCRGRLRQGAGVPRPLADPPRRRRALRRVRGVAVLAGEGDNGGGGLLKTHTAYMPSEPGARRELVRIPDEVQAAVEEAGISEGMVLVSAMHITAGVWVNDDEPGLHEDVLEWLDKVAPPSWKPAPNEVAEELLPEG